METLYKLKEHIIFINEDKSGVSFIKSEECDIIIFESEKPSGVFIEFDWKIYRARDFKIDKAQYDDCGENLVLTYISIDRKIILKEEFFYIGKTVLARKIIIKPRYNGVIKEISLMTAKLKTGKGVEMEIVTPFLPRVSNKIECDIEFLDTPEDSSGVFVVNSIKNSESCAVWFYSEYRFESGYINKEIIYKIKEKRELEAKEEIVAGVQFMSFYKGNYLENIENIEKFFRDKKSLPVIFKKSENGEVDTFFGKMMHYYFKGKIKTDDIYKWLEVEKAVSGKRINDRIYGYLKSKEEFYTESQKENILLFSSMIGRPFILKEEQKYIEEIRENNEILKNGLTLLGKIKTSDNSENISVIKKYRGSFYLAFFNFSPFAREISAKIDEQFIAENIKGYKYFIVNILNGKVEGISNVKDEIKLKFKGYESKIIKLETIAEEEIDGDKIEIEESNEVVNAKNSFFEMVFLKDRRGLYKLKSVQNEKASISGINVNIDGEKFEMKCSKNKVLFQNKTVKMSYLLSGKNYIDFKLEGIFLSAEIIFDMNRAGYFTVDGKYSEKEVVEKSSITEIKYFDKNMVKFLVKKDNSITGVTATKDSLKINFTGKESKKSVSEIRITMI